MWTTNYHQSLLVFVRMYRRINSKTTLNIFLLFMRHHAYQLPQLPPTHLNSLHYLETNPLDAPLVLSWSSSRYFWPYPDYASIRPNTRPSLSFPAQSLGKTVHSKHHHFQRRVGLRAQTGLHMSMPATMPTQRLLHHPKQTKMRGKTGH